MIKILFIAWFLCIVYFLYQCIKEALQESNVISLGDLMLMVLISLAGPILLVSQGLKWFFQLDFWEKPIIRKKEVSK